MQRAKLRSSHHEPSRDCWKSDAGISAAGCMAGALAEETYRALLQQAGFTAIEVEVTRRYSLDEIAESGASASIAVLSADERQDVDGKFVSAFIRAQKPEI